MNVTPPVLTPRLAAAAEMVGKCECFADIGTDHAYLPIYLYMTGKCKAAIASDISEGPLERAKQTAKRYNTDISLRLGSGLDTLKVDEADCVVIAGMGGLLIAEILKNGTDKLNDAKKIILQPMTAVPELRYFLIENGWTIAEERLAKENNKIYVLMSVKRPETEVKHKPYTDVGLYIGKYLIENKPMFYDEYLKRRLNKLKKMTEGLKNSESAESERKRALINKLIDEIKNLNGEI